MWDWLLNPWVVGIGTTVISSGIIWMFSNFWINKKYLSANKEIISCLRPYYSGDLNSIPDDKIIECIISSVSREQGCKVEQLNSVTQVKEDIIRDVVSNFYIPIKIKEEFIEKYINESYPSIGNRKDVLSKSNFLLKQRSQEVLGLFVNIFFLVFSLILGVIGANVFTTEKFNILDSSFGGIRIISIIIPIIIAGLAMFREYIKGRKK